MSGDQIFRPEFDLYVKMTAEAITSIATSHKEAIAENKEYNQILREYIITNNNNHEKTNTRITFLALKVDKVEAAVIANTELTKVAKAIKWAGIIIVAGGLTAYGASLVNNHLVKKQLASNIIKVS